MKLTLDNGYDQLPENTKLYLHPRDYNNKNLLWDLNVNLERTLNKTEIEFTKDDSSSFYDFKLCFDSNKNNIDIEYRLPKGTEENYYNFLETVAGLVNNANYYNHNVFEIQQRHIRLTESEIYIKNKKVDRINFILDSKNRLLCLDDDLVSHQSYIDLFWDGQWSLNINGEIQISNSVFDIGILDLEYFKILLKRSA